MKRILAIGACGIIAISFILNSRARPVDIAADVGEMLPARKPRIPFGKTQQDLAAKLLVNDAPTLLIIGDSWADRCPLRADKLVFPGKPIPKIKDAILARPLPEKQHDFALIIVGIAHMQKTHESIAQTRNAVREFAQFIHTHLSPKTTLVYDPAYMVVLLADQTNRSDGAHLNEKGYNLLFARPHFLSVTFE